MKRTTRYIRLLFILLIPGFISAQQDGQARFQIEIDQLAVNFVKVMDNFRDQRQLLHGMLLDELYRHQIKTDTGSLRIIPRGPDFINVIRDYRSSSKLLSYHDGLPRYIIQLDLYQPSNIQMDIEIQWIDLIDSKVSNKYKFSIRVTDARRLLPACSKRIAESIRLNLTKKVRIAIAPFTPARADSSIAQNESDRYLSDLNNALRHMLGTSLTQIPWIGIANIDMATDHMYDITERQRRQQRQRDRFAHRYLTETAIESGKLVFPNYILQGNLLVSKNLRELYLDCWLVSIESSLLIAADGITIEDTSLNNLSKSVQGLANRLSRLIELQTALNRPPVEIIGVVPNRTMKIEPHKTNRIMEIIGTINLKLRQIIDVNTTFLLSDYDALEDYLKPPGDKRNITYDELLLRYNVDNIVKVNFEETDQRYLITLSLESVKDPRKRPWFSDPFSGEIFNFDQGINDILASLVKPENQRKSAKNDFMNLFRNPDSLNLRQAFRNARIPDAFKNYNLSVYTGLVGRWSSGKDLFLQNSANRMWAISLDIKLPLFNLLWMRELKNWGIGGAAGWDRGGLKHAYEIQGENPGVDIGDVGDIKIDEWFLSLYPVKYFPWRNFEICIGGGPVAFFVNRGVGVGTDQPNGDTDVVIGGALFSGFKGLLYRHHLLNIHIDIRSGIMGGKLKKDSLAISHPVTQFIDLSKTFPDGTLGGYFIGGGLSFSFRP